MSDFLLPNADITTDMIDARSLIFSMIGVNTHADAATLLASSKKISAY